MKTKTLALLIPFLFITSVSALALYGGENMTFSYPSSITPINISINASYTIDDNEFSFVGNCTKYNMTYWQCNDTTIKMTLLPTTINDYTLVFVYGSWHTTEDVVVPVTVSGGHRSWSSDSPANWSLYLKKNITPEENTPEVTIPETKPSSNNVTVSPPVIPEPPITPPAITPPTSVNNTNATDWSPGPNPMWYVIIAFIIILLISGVVYAAYSFFKSDDDEPVKKDELVKKDEVKK